MHCMAVGLNCAVVDQVSLLVSIHLIAAPKTAVDLTTADRDVAGWLDGLNLGLGERG